MNKENAVDRPRKRELLLNGILKENPVLILLLGTCPTLAVTTMAINGIGMGVATLAVLACSNFVISLLRNVISDRVRIPCYIVVIAGFVTVVGMLMEAYVPDLYAALGLFIPLIVVNCIVLGRAEMFASKHGLLDSVFDGVGMGLGFTLALFIMGSIREILGAGTWMGITIFAGTFPAMTIFMLAPGGFFVFGCLIALIRKIPTEHVKQKETFGCEGCAAQGCAGKQEQRATDDADRSTSEEQRKSGDADRNASEEQRKADGADRSISEKQRKSSDADRNASEEGGTCS